MTIERGQYRPVQPPVPTLGEIHKTPGWFWASCHNPECRHSRPLAIAPFVIRWGPEASSDLIRNNLVCERCGRKGATLQHPSWSGSVEAGYASFPIERGAD